MANSENEIYLGRYTIDENGNLQDINGQRLNILEKAGSREIGLGRKARGIVGVAVTLGGLGLAACRPDSSQEPLSPTQLPARTLFELNQNQRLALLK